MSIFNGIKENDIVSIKFKDLKELYSNLDELHVLMDEGFSYNMRAVLNGGMFVVCSAVETDQRKNKDYIQIDNHLDNSVLTIYEDMLEKISVNTDVPSFKSGNHGINIVRLDNQLVINGEPLKLRDPHYATIKGITRSSGEVKRDGDLNDFKSFIESWLIDVATEEAMTEDEAQEKPLQPGIMNQSMPRAKKGLKSGPHKMRKKRR